MENSAPLPPSPDPRKIRLPSKGVDMGPRDDLPFAIPFRCLYSSEIDNLMMAGKHISVTHVAGSVTKFMGNGAQHAIATACAAALCVKYGASRQVHDNHLTELENSSQTSTRRSAERISLRRSTDSSRFRRANYGGEMESQDVAKSMRGSIGMLAMHWLLAPQPQSRLLKPACQTASQAMRLAD